MKTIDPREQTLSRPTTDAHPDARTAPPRTGVLGTILTELEFGADERESLRDLADWLSDDFDEIVETAGGRARTAALTREGLYRETFLEASPDVRPSIRNLRRHAARQWLQATLEGTFDSAFSRQVRHTWMPILLAEQYQTRATPALVAAFLDYLEGYLAAFIVDEVSENLVPCWRMLHAIRTAFDVQRRIFGIENAE